MRRKREFVASCCAATGIIRLLEAIPCKPVLMVLNYHRIGNADETPYDSGVFSCTAEQFEEQIRFLKGRYRIINLEESVRVATNNAILSEPSILITFDDGYIDNYRIAFPILRCHAIQAAFFLPTAFVGTNHLPWWDAIAYIVKHSRKEAISLDYPVQRTFDVRRMGVDRCIKEILALYTHPSMEDSQQFLRDLHRSCESCHPTRDIERCFLNWDEAREMQCAGMAFGSQTHTHEILSKMSAERQREELLVSKCILEHELCRDIDTLAYPVGGTHAFSAETIDALQATRYRAAFSFYGGFNRPPKIKLFDIRRLGICDQSPGHLRLQAALGAVSGTMWR